MKRVLKKEIVEPEDDIEIIVDELDGDQHVLNFVFPEDFDITKCSNAPIFVNKLRAIIEDEDNKNIISWNEIGDGFIIHDQLQFLSKILPKYFKHNNLASFVRQLNLYGFHKTQNLCTSETEFQFSHQFFVRAMPQLMEFIKRKTNIRQPATKVVKKLPTQFDQLMKVVKEIKIKNDSISDDLIKVRQENAALWGEVNNLRVKYSKQSKIVNKLIQFLISYIQKRHSTRPNTRPANDTEDCLKGGPKIMELDYRYKNNPHEFWTDFDKEIAVDKPAEQEIYTVVEPGEDTAQLNQQPETHLNSPLPSNVEDFLLNNELPVDLNLPQIDYDSNQQPSSKPNDRLFVLERAGSSKDNVNYVADNSQFDMNATIKELLKNLPPDELSTFCKLFNDTSNHDETDTELSEKELRSLSDGILPSNDGRDEIMDIDNTDEILFDSTVDQYLNMD